MATNVIFSTLRGTTTDPGKFLLTSVFFSTSINFSPATHALPVGVFDGIGDGVAVRDMDVLGDAEGVLLGVSMLADEGVDDGLISGCCCCWDPMLLVCLGLNPNGASIGGGVPPSNRAGIISRPLGAKHGSRTHTPNLFVELKQVVLPFSGSKTG